MAALDSSSLPARSTRLMAAGTPSITARITLAWRRSSSSARFRSLKSASVRGSGDGAELVAQRDRAAGDP